MQADCEWSLRPEVGKKVTFTVPWAIKFIIKILGPLWFAENKHTHYICWIDSFFGDDESGVRTLLQIDSQEEFSIFFKSL